jgi:hypothetical protein
MFLIVCVSMMSPPLPEMFTDMIDLPVLVLLRANREKMASDFLVGMW